MGARADVPEARDRRFMARGLGERAPEKVLVEGTRAAVDVTADEVHVESFDVGR